MWVRITSKEEVGFLDNPLVVKYGGHNDQLSKKYWGMDRFRIKSLEKNSAKGRAATYPPPLAVVGGHAAPYQSPLAVVGGRAAPTTCN